MSKFLLPAQAPGYRADIDGLRAVAVLAVVLFHIDPAWLPGGFAGVDIFFVISGYLITGNILREAASPHGFSFAEFYRRRALRIIPVLAVVVLVTLLFGQFILLPEDLLELGASAVAAVFSVANIYFTYFLDTSYFADDSNLQPLLHLWSLGVEEQFYLFWPVVLLLLLSRVSKVALVAFVLAVIVLSFGLAEYLLDRSPMFAYYMLPTRAGELLLGALAAIWLSGFRGRLAPVLCNGLALAGCVLIVYSLIWVHEDMGFPGVNALFSTLGAMLVIVAGAQGLQPVSRLLAFRPLVFIGLLSYSLYLWHWPVLAYYRYAFGVVEAGAGLVLLLTMFALSYLSYRWVEKPLRRLRWSFAKVSTVIVGGSTVTLVSLCGAFFLSKGFGLYLYDDEYKAALLAEQPSPAAYSYPYVCQRPALRAVDIANKECVINGEQEPDVLLWGDSNAAHYVGVVGAISERAGFSFRNIAHSSCPPVFTDVDKMVRPERAQGCLASLRLVEEVIDQYSTLVLGAAWANYFARNPDFPRIITETVQGFAAQGKKVIILGQIPALGSVDRKCRQKSLKISVLSCQDQGVAQDDGDSEANKFMANLAANTPGVDYFDPRDFICSAGVCGAYVDDKFIYYDKSHLSMEGSWLVGRKVVEHGIPRSFLDLQGQGGLQGHGNKSLQHWLLERGRERFQLGDTDWASLLSPESSQGWSGNAVMGKHPRLDGYLVEDVSADKFGVFNYSFLPSDYLRGTADAHALVAKLEVSGCLSDYPMMRFWLQGEQPEKYDVILNCQTGEVKTKGAMGRQDAYAEKTPTGFMVYAYVPVAASVDDAKVTVYPASGISFGSYSQAAVGGVVIKNLHLAPASASVQ